MHLWCNVVFVFLLVVPQCQTATNRLVFSIHTISLDPYREPIKFSHFSIHPSIPQTINSSVHLVDSLQSNNPSLSFPQLLGLGEVLKDRNGKISLIFPVSLEGQALLQRNLEDRDCHGFRGRQLAFCFIRRSAWKISDWEYASEFGKEEKDGFESMNILRQRSCGGFCLRPFLKGRERERWWHINNEEILGVARETLVFTCGLSND